MGDIKTLTVTQDNIDRVTEPNPIYASLKFIGTFDRIDLRNKCIEGTLAMNGLTVHGDIDLTNAKIGCFLYIKETIVGGSYICEGMHVNKRTVIYGMATKETS